MGELKVTYSDPKDNDLTFEVAELRILADTLKERLDEVDHYLEEMRYQMERVINTVNGDYE